MMDTTPKHNSLGKKTAVTSEIAAVIKEDFGVAAEPGTHLADLFDSIIKAHSFPMSAEIERRRKASIIKKYMMVRKYGGVMRMALLIFKEIKVIRGKIKSEKIIRRKPQDWLDNKKFMASTKAAETTEGRVSIGNLPHDKFYQTKEWRTLRYHVIRKYGNVCMCCGKSPKDGAIIEVDHIMPRSSFPEYALAEHNLQVLCAVCNSGKSNIYMDDWSAVDSGFPVYLVEGNCNG
jgi:hypothetical protein